MVLCLLHQLAWDCLFKDSGEPPVFLQRHVFFCTLRWRWQHSPILFLTLWQFTLPTDPCWTTELSNLNEYTVSTFCILTCSKHVLCNTGCCYYLSLCYPCPCTHSAKIVKNCMWEFPTVLRVTSVDYEFPSWWRFPSGAHVLFCPSLLSAHTHTHARVHHTFSQLLTPASAVCVWGSLLLSLWLLKIYWPCCSCTATICRRKHTSYNIHVKLDVMCRKKRDERATDIAHATHIPDMMRHTTLKSAHGVETKSVKPHDCENCMPKCDVMEGLEWNLATRIESCINIHLSRRLLCCMGLWRRNLQF
jgi:hypothetical protein